MDPLQEADTEKASWENLHRTFSSSLHRYFNRRVRDASVAEDMVQQVFERLVRRGALETIANVGGYVFQIARSVMADHLRQGDGRHFGMHDRFEEAQHGGVTSSPESLLSKKERLSRAIRVLESLPERTRVIFVLRRLDGLRYREIAERFGISVSAVEKHLERAMAHLAKGMEDDI